MRWRYGDEFVDFMDVVIEDGEAYSGEILEDIDQKLRDEMGVSLPDFRSRFDK